MEHTAHSHTFAVTHDHASTYTMHAPAQAADGPASAAPGPRWAAHTLTFSGAHSTLAHIRSHTRSCIDTHHARTCPGS